MSIQSNNYPLWMIHSGRSLTEIYDIVKDNAQEGEKIGPIRIDLHRGVDKCRVIFMFDEAIREHVMGQRLYDLNIVPYKIRPNLYPGHDNNRNLFIFLPDNLSLFECHKSLEDKMKEFVKFNLVKLDDYNIKIPPKVRGSEVHRGVCYIYFNNHIDTDQIVLIRIMLHNSRWTSSELSQDVINCRWQRAKTMPTVENKLRPPTVSKPLQIKKRDNTIETKDSVGVETKDDTIETKATESVVIYETISTTSVETVLNVEDKTKTNWAKLVSNCDKTTE